MIDTTSSLDIVEGRKYKHDEHGRVCVHRVAIRMKGVRAEGSDFGVTEQRPLIESHVLFTIKPDADEPLHHKYMEKEVGEDFMENATRWGTV